MNRITLPVLVAVAAALVAALPAAAKNGVKATLTTRIPLDAKAGTPLHVGWTLAYPDADGQLHPFGAGGVFVRLVSASGADARTGYSNGDGAFRATVVVPEGGIADVLIGLRSWTNGKDGTKEGDMLFPITNDPLPGAARIVPPEPSGGGSTGWIAGSVAASLLALCALWLARRRHAGRRPAGAPASAEPGL